MKKNKRVKNKGGEWCIVVFKYEKLGMFCFVCGILGHNEARCEMRFAMENDNGLREWWVELRADNRRSSGAPVSRWLKEEKGSGGRNVDTVGGGSGTVPEPEQQRSEVTTVSDEPEKLAVTIHAGNSNVSALVANINGMTNNQQSLIASVVSTMAIQQPSASPNPNPHTYGQNQFASILSYTETVPGNGNFSGPLFSQPNTLSPNLFKHKTSTQNTQNPFSFHAANNTNTLFPINVNQPSLMHTHNVTKPSLILDSNPMALKPVARAIPRQKLNRGIQKHNNMSPIYLVVPVTVALIAT